MKCPKCKYEWKHPGFVRGGAMSKRTITPEQQAVLQAARRNGKKNKGGAK